MGEDADTRGTGFDFTMIKANLNTSMEQDGITVSEELIQKTVNKIKTQTNLNSSKTSNNQKWKKKLNFTNVAAAVLIVFLVGTVAGKNLLDSNKPSNMVRMDNKAIYEVDEPLEANDVSIDTFDGGILPASEENVDNEGEVEAGTDSEPIGGIDSKDGNNYTGDTDDIPTEDDINKNGIFSSNIINLEVSDVESLEVSYYVDSTVINKDLTIKIEDVFILLNTYTLEETSANPVEEWTHKLNVIPSGDSIYTILIGNNIEIIKETKTSKSISLDEASDIIRESFIVEDIVGLKIQLDQIINMK